MVLGNSMDRRRLYQAWQSFYARTCPIDRLVAIRERISFLEGRMRKMARFPGSKSWHGIPNVRLQVALGMSLGVHKQLLWGLTSDPGWGMLEGGREGNRLQTAT